MGLVIMRLSSLFSVFFLLQQIIVKSSQGMCRRRDARYLPRGFSPVILQPSGRGCFVSQPLPTIILHGACERWQSASSREARWPYMIQSWHSRLHTHLTAPTAWMKPQPFPYGRDLSADRAPVLPMLFVCPLAPGLPLGLTAP